MRTFTVVKLTYYNLVCLQMRSIVRLHKKINDFQTIMRNAPNTCVDWKLPIIGQTYFFYNHSYYPLPKESRAIVRFRVRTQFDASLTLIMIKCWQTPKWEDLTKPILTSETRSKLKIEKTLLFFMKFRVTRHSAVDVYKSATIQDEALIVLADESWFVTRFFFIVPCFWYVLIKFSAHHDRPLLLNSV